jgi:hypothetical protein
LPRGVEPFEGCTKPDFLRALVEGVPVDLLDGVGLAFELDLAEEEEMLERGVLEIFGVLSCVFNLVARVLGDSDSRRFSKSDAEDAPTGVPNEAVEAGEGEDE